MKENPGDEWCDTTPPPTPLTEPNVDKYDPIDENEQPGTQEGEKTGTTPDGYDKNHEEVASETKTGSTGDDYEPIDSNEQIEPFRGRKKRKHKKKKH